MELQNRNGLERAEDNNYMLIGPREQPIGYRRKFVVSIVLNAVLITLVIFLIGIIVFMAVTKTFEQNSDKDNFHKITQRPDVPRSSICQPCDENEIKTSHLRKSDNLGTRYMCCNRDGGTLPHYKLKDRHREENEKLVLQFTNDSLNCATILRGISLEGKLLKFGIDGYYEIVSRVQFDTSEATGNFPKKVTHGIIINDDFATLGNVYLPKDSGFVSSLQTFVKVEKGDTMYVYVNDLSFVYKQPEYNTLGICKVYGQVK